MNHPYSGPASYIYANEFLSLDNPIDKGPYAHMRSFVPMLSMESLPQHWPPIDDLERASVWPPSDQKALVEPNEDRRPDRAKKLVWRRRLQRGIRRALRSIRRLLYERIPAWIGDPRPPLSAVD